MDDGRMYHCYGCVLDMDFVDFVDLDLDLEVQQQFQLGGKPLLTWR
jgi:hypothetical protein